MFNEGVEIRLGNGYPEYQSSNIKVTVLRPYRWSLITKSLFYMFLLTSPLNVYGLGTRGFNYRFSRIFLILSVLAITIERIAKKRDLLYRLLPFDYLVGIYWSLALLSAFYVLNFGAFNIRFFGLAECLMMLYAIRMFTREKGYWLKSLQIYLLSSIPVLLASLYQIVNISRGNLYGPVLPFPSLLLLDRYEELGVWQYFGGIIQGVSRIPSTFADPNTLAGYCASLIPFAIVIVLISYKNRALRRKSFLNLLILLGLVVMVIASVSKSGILGMVLGILLTMIFTYMKMGPKQKRLAIIVTTLILVCIVFYGLRIIDYIAYRLSLGDSGHLEYSLSAWNDYFHGSWLLGEGFGQYEYVSAHVIVITALFELGIFGGIIVFLLTMQPFAYIRYLFGLSSRMKQDPRAKPWYIFMSAGLASYFTVVLGLYLYDYWLHPFTWIAISLLLSLVSLTKNEVKRGAFTRL